MARCDRGLATTHQLSTMRFGEGKTTTVMSLPGPTTGTTNTAS